MYLFSIIHRGIGNGENRDQISPPGLIWVCTVCIRHFVGKVGYEVLGQLS